MGPCNKSAAAGEPTMRIQRLFIYPIKSLRPVEVRYAEVTDAGFRFDRQYILAKAPTDSSTPLVEHLTSKKVYSLGLFQPSIHQGWSRLTIRHVTASPESSVTIPLTPPPMNPKQAQTYTVTIFGTSTPCVDMGEEPASFFSAHLGFPVRLLYIAGDGHRAVPGSAAAVSHFGPSPFGRAQLDNVTRAQRIRFADAAPFSVTSTASEIDARCRLPLPRQHEDVIIRFRPNIHVDVGDDTPAYDEDHWKELVVFNKDLEERKAIIRCIFKTARCLSLNGDPFSGKTSSRDTQMYGLLAKDRRVNSVFPHKPVFGQYAYAVPIGAVLRVGDQVKVSLRSDDALDTTSRPNDRTV